MAQRKQFICRRELQEADLGLSQARNRSKLGFLGPGLGRFQRQDQSFGSPVQPWPLRCPCLWQRSPQGFAPHLCLQASAFLLFRWPNPEGTPSPASSLSVQVREGCERLRIFAIMAAHLFIFRSKWRGLQAEPIHRAYRSGTIAFKYIFWEKEGGQGVSGRPVADVVIGAKPLLPFAGAPPHHIFPVVPGVLSSTSSHPVINTPIWGPWKRRCR